MNKISKTKMVVFKFCLGFLVFGGLLSWWTSTSTQDKTGFFQELGIILLIAFAIAILFFVGKSLKKWFQSSGIANKFILKYWWIDLIAVIIGILLGLWIGWLPAVIIAIFLAFLGIEWTIQSLEDKIKDLENRVSEAELTEEEKHKRWMRIHDPEGYSTMLEIEYSAAEARARSDKQ